LRQEPAWTLAAVVSRIIFCLLSYSRIQREDSTKLLRSLFRSLCYDRKQCSFQHTIIISYHSSAQSQLVLGSIGESSSACPNSCSSTPSFFVAGAFFPGRVCIGIFGSTFRGDELAFAGAGLRWKHPSTCVIAAVLLRLSQSLRLHVSHWCDPSAMVLL
jgi:hypothetical protein